MESYKLPLTGKELKEKLNAVEAFTAPVTGVENVLAQKVTLTEEQIAEGLTENITYADNTAAFGISTTAGSKGYRIIDVRDADTNYFSADNPPVTDVPGVYVIDTTEDFPEILRTGILQVDEDGNAKLDEDGNEIYKKISYSIYLQSNADAHGVITGINNDEKFLYTDKLFISDTIAKALLKKHNPDVEAYKDYPDFADYSGSYIKFSDFPNIGDVNIGEGAIATGYQTKALAIGAHAEGYATTASGKYSHAEGQQTFSGYDAHAEGYKTKAIGLHSHAEGSNTRADGIAAHSEGQETKALKKGAHAEGLNNIADGQGAHAEGEKTNALGYASHTEGGYTKTAGDASVFTIDTANKSQYILPTNQKPGTSLIGADCTVYLNDGTVINSTIINCGKYGSPPKQRIEINPSDYTQYEVDQHKSGGVIVVYRGSNAGKYAHAQGYKSYAIGNYSHAGGSNTVAIKDAQTVIGTYNTPDATSLFIVGNGTSDTERSNAFTVSKDGTAYANGKELATTEYVNTSAPKISGTAAKDIGGISKGTVYTDSEISKILSDLLFYAAPSNLSISTTDSSGTKEYGTIVEITKVTPTFTKGSKDIISIKIGTTEGGAELYSGTSATSNTEITLKKSVSYDGTSGGKIYCTISDGDNSISASTSVSYTYYDYSKLTTSTTASTSGATKQTSSGADNTYTYSSGQYLWLYSRSSGKKIQQYISGTWADVNTSDGTSIILTLANGTTATYYAYRTDKFTASGSARYRLA